MCLLFVVVFGRGKKHIQRYDLLGDSGDSGTANICMFGNFQDFRSNMGPM